MLRILDQLLPPDDHATVARLNHDAFVLAHASVLSADAMQQSTLDAAIESWSKFPNPNCQYGFAYDGDELVGFTVVRRCRMEEYAEYGGMTSLYVHVDHHKRGVGQALLQWGIDRMRSTANGKMFVTVVSANSARDFYLHTGAEHVVSHKREVFGDMLEVDVLCYTIR